MTTPGRMFAAATAVLLLLLTACGEDEKKRVDPEDVPEGTVISVEELARDHVAGDLDYPQSPPVGGAHNPVWLSCGVYTEPVPDENAVHSMEHGAVWISYAEDLPEDQVATLTAFADEHDYLVIAPYPGLSSPIVLTAWGYQLSLDDADDPRVAQFIDVFEEGAQAPEAGASCTGGAMP